MIYALLLLSSLASAQEVSTSAPEGLSMEDTMSMSNMSKQIIELQGGRPKITGLPKYQKGIQFLDGTIQTTAASAGVSVNSTNTWTAPNAFLANQTTGFSEISISTPAANSLYSDSLPKAWVTFNGTGTVLLQASFNVNYVTDGGAGDWTIHFAVPFKTLNYACVCTLESSIVFGTDAEKCGFVQGSRTVSTIRIHDVNSTDAVSARDPDRVNVVCFGRQ